MQGSTKEALYFRFAPLSFFERGGDVIGDSTSFISDGDGTAGSDGVGGDGAMDVGGDAATDDIADIAQDTANLTYSIALNKPYSGQTFAAGTPVEVQAIVQGPPAAIASTALVWSLADADGTNVAALNGGDAVLGSGGVAKLTWQLPKIGVHLVDVTAKASGGIEVTATATVVVCPLGLKVVSVDGETAANAMLAAGKAIELVAEVSGVEGPGAELEVVSDFDGVLAAVAIVGGGAGPQQLKIQVTPKTNGEHQIGLRLVGGGATCALDGMVNVRVCGAEIVEEFTTDITGSAWKKSGAAAWDSGGWLELTGNAGGKGGAVYNSAVYVQPGDVRMTMRIATGGGINGGADGFAMTILEAEKASEVDAYLALAGNGGCLGYGVSGACGKTKVEAFHVEIDTWLNKGDPNTDPPGVAGNNAVLGQGNHIAVHLDGDAGNALLWLPEPGKPAISVEDLAWHTVTIIVQGDKLTIRLDDTLATTKTVSGLDFRGGYVIFSGSTGWATNFHRIDDLRILHQCN